MGASTSGNNSANLTKAIELLNEVGLTPSSLKNKDQELAFERLVNSIDSGLDQTSQKKIYELRQDHRDDEVRQVLQQAVPPEKLLALNLVNGSVQLDASEFEAEYYRFINADRKQRNSISLAFKGMIGFLGNKPPAEFTRQDVRSLISAYLSGEITGKPLKTKSVHRRLTTISKSIQGSRERV